MNEWISVNEKLPEIGNFVIILSRKKTWKRHYQIYYGLYWEHSKSWNILSSLSATSYTKDQLKSIKLYITHWMPLPKLPEAVVPEPAIAEPVASAPSHAEPAFSLRSHANDECQ